METLRLEHFSKIFNYLCIKDLLNLKNVSSFLSNILCLYFELKSICNICGAKLKNLKSLNQDKRTFHNYKVTKIKKICCPLCTQKFLSNEERINQLISIHNKNISIRTVNIENDGKKISFFPRKFPFYEEIFPFFKKNF